jgi:hypothetical protein
MVWVVVPIPFYQKIEDILDPFIRLLSDEESISGSQLGFSEL